MSDSTSKLPVYFLSIGGPNFIENTEHPAFKQLGKVGREITTQVRPKAVVVISAHWQESQDKIAVNIDEDPGLIYDFNGFPRHYYEIKYPYKGSRQVAGRVIDALQSAGIATEKVKRGLDHGVWVGFLAAFDPVTNPLDVPIVQVSLYANEDLNKHIRLGQALEKLRSEGVLIIGAGMAAHNLLDFRNMRMTGQLRNMPYATSFDEGLAEAVTHEPENRQARMLSLASRKDFRAAHPTAEHLLPIYVASGAAGKEPGTRLWTMAEGSLNWAQYRFGNISTEPTVVDAASG